MAEENVNQISKIPKVRKSKRKAKKRRELAAGSTFGRPGVVDSEPTLNVEKSNIIKDVISNQPDIGEGEVSDVLRKKNAIGAVSSKYRDSFEPKVQGGGFDEDGVAVTPQSQLYKAVTKKDDPTDTRTLSEISDEINRASLFNEELSIERDKAKTLVGVAERSDAYREDDEIEPPVLNINDIYNEMESLVSGFSSGDINTEDQFRQLLNNARSTPINYGEPAIERLGLTDYYPDINTPLQVGTYSGSIIGSNPIFAAGGGYFPIGVYDARKRAMERAAQNRVKQGEKIKNLMMVDSAEQYQDKLNEKGLEIFNKHGEGVGWDYNKLMDMSNPEAREFQEEYQKYRSTAKRTISIQKQYQDVLDAWKNQGKFIPSSVMSLMQDWQSGSNDIEGMVDDPALLDKIERGMQYYDNLTTDAEDLVSKIQKDQNFFDGSKTPSSIDEFREYEKELETIKNARNYDILRTTSFKYVPAERIRNLVDLKAEYNNYHNKEQAKLDMFSYINDLISTEITPKYIEAANRGTSVSVHNYPADVNQTNETAILANRDEWRSGLVSSMDIGDRRVANTMEKQMGLDPVVDENGEFKEGIIRGKYDLSKDQNNGEFNYSAGDLTFMTGGEEYTLDEYQYNLLRTKYGFDDNKISAYAAAKGEAGKSDEELMNDLINGTLGVQFNPEDSYMLSRNESSSINTKWSSKYYTEKWKDEKGQEHNLTMNDTDRVGISEPWHDISGGIIDPGTGGVFGGVTFKTSYNLNLFLGGAPASETYSGGPTRALKSSSKQGEQSATKDPEGETRVGHVEKSGKTQL